MAAFVTTLVAGSLINWLDADESSGACTTGSVVGGEKASSADSSSAQPDDVGPAFQPVKRQAGKPVPQVKRLRLALRFGMVDLLADLSHWLLLGFVLAGFLSAMLPEGFLAERLGSGVGAMLVMLLVGLPMYVCATSSTPVAAALIAGGLSPGAALVFLLAGPATNTTTMLVILRDLGRRSLVIYLMSISMVAVLCGWIMNVLLGDSSFAVRQLSPVGTGPGAITLVFGLLLAALMLNGLRIRLRRLFSV